MVCVLMHYLQPHMSVGIQEVIIICVPEGMRYNVCECDTEERRQAEQRQKRERDDI